MTRTGDTAPAAGFTALLRIREFRLLWLADAQSLLGDQLARVALSVLVYDRIRAGHRGGVRPDVPAGTGGRCAAGSARRPPAPPRLTHRRGSHSRRPARGDGPARAVGARPGHPARRRGVGRYPVESRRVRAGRGHPHRRGLPTGLGLRTVTGQAAQVVGFAVGGIAIAAVGARSALALDAATFLISAAVIRLGVRTRPTAAHPDIAAAESPQRWLHGAATVLSDRRLRLLLGLAWLLGLLVIPEGLAAPYAQHLGGGARTVGLLLAAGPMGVLVGTVCYTRLLSAPTRATLLGPLAAATGIPLLFCATTPNLAITCLLWALSGACTAYQIQVVAEFVHTISPSIRGQGIGIASAGLLAAQGIGLLAGGAITQISAPADAIVTAGAAATALGSALALTRRAHHEATPAPLD